MNDQSFAEYLKGQATVYGDMVTLANGLHDLVLQAYKLDVIRRQSEAFRGKN